MNSFMIAMIQYNRSSKCLDGRSKELKLFGRGVEFCWHMLKTCCSGRGVSLINLYESIKNFSVGLFIHSHVHVFRSANNTPEPELFDKRNTKIYMKFWNFRILFMCMYNQPGVTNHRVGNINLYSQLTVMLIICFQFKLTITLFQAESCYEASNKPCNHTRTHNSKKMSNNTRA